MRYDRDVDNYVPSLEGTVSGIGYRGYLVDGEWVPKETYPLFKTREECEEHIRLHPHSAPTIKGDE